MIKQQKILVPLARAQAWPDDCILSRKADGQTAEITIAGQTVLCEQMRQRSGGIYTPLDLERFMAHGDFLLAFDVNLPDGARVRREWLGDCFAVGGWVLHVGRAPCYLVEFGHGPAFLAQTMASGAEGVCCRRPDASFFEPFECFKKTETHDLVVVGVDYATGSLSLETTDGCPRGNCPCRQCVPVGSIVEVAAMGLTAAGKLREPRFIRVRTDKMAHAF